MKTQLLKLPFVIGALVFGSAVLAEPFNFAPANFAIAPTENVKLGQLLFYDPVLSGNKNIACSTCHHPKFGTSDGVSLGLGEGGIGLGTKRIANVDNLPEQRIGRNAPALFNLGAAEFTSLFHDGRLEAGPTRPSGIRTPLDEEMVVGFNSVLSAQAMFPVLSGDEMAGHYSENDVSQAVRQGFLAHQGGAWDIIAKRVSDIPEYREMFQSIIGEKPIAFTDISNVIADFIAFEWRADNSAFDRFLLGEPMTTSETNGMNLFYGDAGCASCHSGRFQTDQNFHAIAMPQIGPGKAARFENHHRDVGRMRVTGQVGDAYKFRTPSLRNITSTGPYGHDGAYSSLRDVVMHHLDPVSALGRYDIAMAILPELPNSDDQSILNSERETAEIIAANELEPVSLSDSQVDDLIAFLHALTDKTASAGRLGIPETVPSGLPLD